MTRRVNKPNTFDYKEFQKKVSKNIKVVDGETDVQWLSDYKTGILETSNSRWAAGIKYGASNWPIDEWGYTIVNKSKWHDGEYREENEEIWNFFKDYFLEEFDLNPIITGMHLNATSFGQETRIHVDSTSDCDVFIILFLNDDMDVYDGGEFQTYINLEPNIDINKNFHLSEINKSVSPKFGRFLIGDARALHRGLAPTRFYEKIRLTMAIKMKFENVKDAFRKIGFKYL